MHIYVINGKPGTGKTTFAIMCQEIDGNGNVLNISTVDLVKDIASQCGWAGTKTANDRKFLADLKQLLIAWGDVPYKDVRRKIALWKAEREWEGADSKDLVVFIHCREPEEIQKFVDRMGAQTIYVRRNTNEACSNDADANVDNYDYDYTICNTGDLEHLRASANTFMINQDFD